MLFQKKINSVKIILIIIFIIITSASIFPLLKEIKNISDKYIEGSNKMEEIDKKIEMTNSQEKDLEIATAGSSKIEKAFLEQRQEKIAEFISSIENVAKETGVSFRVQSATSPTKTTPYLTFQVHLKGGFQNLLRFIAALGDSPEGFYRLIEIRRINMRRIGEEGTELESNLEMRVYTEM